MPTLKANEQLLRTKDFCSRSRSPFVKKCVLIVPYFYIWKIEFFNFFLSCWKPLVPDGFWFLCYLLQVLRKISFLLLIDINMWHYKEYSPSSYMWKKKLWRIKKMKKKIRLKICQIVPFTKMVENQVNLTSFFYISFCLKIFVKLHHFRFLNIEKLVLVVSISQIVGSFNMGKCRVVESRTRASFAIKSTCKPR